MHTVKLAKLGVIKDFHFILKKLFIGDQLAESIAIKLETFFNRFTYIHTIQLIIQIINFLSSFFSYRSKKTKLSISVRNDLELPTQQ